LYSILHAEIDKFRHVNIYNHILIAFLCSHNLKRYKMKKEKTTEKKLSLNKLQITKIKTGLNSIKGGSEGGGTGATGDNDTIKDKTDNTTTTKDVLTLTN